MLWTKISPKSVKLTGLDPLACGFIPAGRSPSQKWKFGHELWLSGPRECSIGMKQQFWTYLGVKEPVGSELASLLVHGGWRTWRRWKTCAWEAQSGSIGTEGSLAVDLGKKQSKKAPKNG